MRTCLKVLPISPLRQPSTGAPSSAAAKGLPTAATACLIDAITTAYPNAAMTDSRDEKDGRTDVQPPPARLPQPVRGITPAPALERQAPEPGKPTPIRDVAKPVAPRVASPDEKPDDGEATVEVDGTLWTVRVQGRSGGGSSAKPPLLLLGFWRVATVDSQPDREAMVVGRRFSDLTDGDLETALAESRDPSVVDRSKAFFSEISERRRS